MNEQELRDQVFSDMENIKLDLADRQYEDAAIFADSIASTVAKLALLQKEIRSS